MAKCHKLLRNFYSPAGNPGASGCGRGRDRGRRLRLRPGEERLRQSRTVDTWSRSRAPWSGYCCCCTPSFIHSLCVLQPAAAGLTCAPVVSVRQLHREFLRAGANVMQTFTFYASDDKLENRGNKQRFTVSTAVCVCVCVCAWLQLLSSFILTRRGWHSAGINPTCSSSSVNWSALKLNVWHMPNLQEGPNNEDRVRDSVSFSLQSGF